MIFLLSIMLAAQSVSAAAQEIPRMEQMVEVTAPIPDNGAPATFCTQDKRWCAFISRDVDLNTSKLMIYNGQLPPIIQGGRSYARDVGRYDFSAAVDGDSDNASFNIWPTIIRQPTLHSDGLKPNETITVGIETSISTGYSGGGAHATWLQLYQLSPTTDGSMPQPINFGTVLNVPLRGAKLIRACFGDEAYEKRRGACHDEYDFNAELKLGKTMPDGQPQIIYQSIATAAPGTSRLSNDNSRRRLSAADLKPRRDRKCSYRRIYAFNGELGMYFAAKPAPDCSDFLVP